MSEPVAPTTVANALRAVLAPLARLALAHGLPYHALDELLRSALISQARALHVGEPRHGLVSRISTTTGLTRREVSRRLAAPDDTSSPHRSLAGEVFARWVSDPAYQEGERARPLPRTGPAPSFEALAQAITRDVHPRSLLEELCRLGLARHHVRSDTVTLERDAFVPHADREHMLALLSDNVGDHLEAAVENVLGAGSEHFEQAVFADELSTHSVQALRPLIAAQWNRLLNTLAPALEALIAEDQAAGRAQDQRVRIGFYSFEAPMSESGATPRSAASQTGQSRDRDGDPDQPIPGDPS